MVMVLIVAVIMTMFGIYLLNKTGLDIQTTGDFQNKKSLEYFLEAGSKILMEELQKGLGFHVTHAGDGVTKLTGGTGSCQYVTCGAGFVQPLEPTIKIGGRLPFIDMDGYYTWRWSKDSSFSNFTGSGESEELRMRVFFPTALNPMGVGNSKNKLFLQSEVHTKLDQAEAHAVLSTEVWRLRSDFIVGTIVSDGWANINAKTNLYVDGDVYFAPGGSSQNYYQNQYSDLPLVNVTGKIIRSRAGSQGPASPTANIWFDKDPDTSYANYVEMELGSPYSDDSENPSWKSLAISQWAGMVIDGSTGAYKLLAPKLGSADFYKKMAQCCNGIAENLSSGVVKTVFPLINQCLAKQYPLRQVSSSLGSKEYVYKDQVTILNMASVVIPSTGVIYCDRSLVLTSASTIQNHCTIIVNGNIYLHGNFNTSNSKDVTLILLKGYFFTLANTWDVTDSAYGWWDPYLSDEPWNDPIKNLGKHYDPSSKDPTQSLEFVATRVTRWFNITSSNDPESHGGSLNNWAGYDLTQRGVDIDFGDAVYEDSTQANYQNPNYAKYKFPYFFRRCYQRPDNRNSYYRDSPNSPYTPRALRITSWKQTYQ